MSFYYSTFNSDLSETVAYNHPLFPVYIRQGFLSAYPNYSAVSHWHDDLEFIVILHGIMTYHVNGQCVTLSEGNGIFVNSRQLHFGFSSEHKECEFICILISPSLLTGNDWFYKNYITRITENPAIPFLYLDRMDWRGSILKILEMMYKNYDLSDAASYFEMIESFLSICKILYTELPADPDVNAHQSEALSCVKNMITYIDKHYMDHITLTKIASSGKCCKSKCSMLFKSYLHDTPITYTTKVRLRKSLSSLLETDDSIIKIAYDSGFHSESYYCETFKKYYQISPAQYRKQYRQ